VEKILTDNPSETITIKWDGERFILVQGKQMESTSGFAHITGYTAIILNPREMLELVEFASKQGGKRPREPVEFTARTDAEEDDDNFEGGD